MLTHKVLCRSMRSGDLLWPISKTLTFINAFTLPTGSILGLPISSRGPVNRTWLNNKHINVLELLAVFLALEHFLPHLHGCHTLIRTDNSTVVAYKSPKGGVQTVFIEIQYIKGVLGLSVIGLSTDRHGVIGASAVARGISQSEILTHQLSEN